MPDETPPADACPFTQEYYMDGVNRGISNYENYRFLPDSGISMATHLMRHLGIQSGDRVLDFGAARGFYVRALRMLGVQAFGYDISKWAVENCDESVRPFMSNHLNLAPLCYDIIFSKDVWEHIPEDELLELIPKLLSATLKKLFIIVPLSPSKGFPYIHPKEEKDVTHVIRWNLHEWLLFLQELAPNFTVSGSYRMAGIKPGAYEVECGYGFLTCTRFS